MSIGIETLQERRKIPRVEFQGRVELEAPPRPTHLAASSLNLSEGGICVRLQESLEVRSSVTLRLFAQPRSRPFECAGRVAWVVQRLDLRSAPPFLYDVGVELLNPSSRLRQFASRVGFTLRPSPAVRVIAQSRQLSKRVSRNVLQPATINGRCYEPRVVQEPSASMPWHLIVVVEGAPCFSRRCPSEREAIASWKQFRRQAALPARPGDRGAGGSASRRFR